MSAIGSTKRHTAHARGSSPRGGEERPVGARLGPERRPGRREGRQAVRGRDDEALARTLDDEAASVTNGDDT